MTTETTPDRDFHIVRLLAALEAIPDPVERATECLRVGGQARDIHIRLAEIRRQAVYEATLKPAATGRSVAQALGVSAKTVSQASSEFRRRDLEQLDRAAGVLSEILDDNDPALIHLLDVRASTRSVLLIAQALVGTYGAYISWSVKPENGDDERHEELHDAYTRADYLCAVGKVKIKERITVPGLAFAEPSYVNTPLELLWPVKVLNAMPGILAHGTIHDYPDGSEWSLGWQILPAERYTSVFDAGPDPDGWAVTEWLIWLARDFARGDFGVSSRVHAAPPFLNEPGEELTFLIEGAMNPDAGKLLTADEFADQVIKVWDGTGPASRAGYFEVRWPAREEDTR